MNTWINLARRLAKRSLHPKQQMAAVIVSGGRVLCWATNGPKWGAHAELRAIARAPIPLDHATLIVARITGDGLAKPCSMCQGAISGAYLYRVLYTTADGFQEEFHVYQ